MENISYFYAASAYEAPEDLEFVPLQINFNFLPQLNWKKFSSQTAMGFLMVALSLSVLSAAGEAMAAEKVGSKEAKVVAIQRCLKDKGYLKGKVDGYFGPMTKKAVTSYQKANNLIADGIVGTRTAQKLNSHCSSSNSSSTNNSVLKQGSRGSAVKKLQDNLRTLGIYNSRSTGYYGPVTKNVVISFQRSQGLKTDGIVGPNTQAKIQAALNGKGNGNGNGNSTQYSTLRVGSRGSQVTYLQRKLRKLGYFKGNPTGYFGPITKNAVISFQSSRGLKTDGIVGQNTWDALRNSSPGRGGKVNVILRRGDSGSKVRELQRRLKIEVDGLFGPATEAAVRRFQSSKGLPVTGVVDSRTWKKLAPVKPQPKPPSRCINRPTLSYGARGSHVTYLQKRLRDWGYFSSNPTSYFGPGTEASVKRFQQAKELYPDGIVSKDTWQALESTGKCAKRYTVVVPLTNPGILQRVRSFAPNATVNNSRLGKYVNAGNFASNYRAKQLNQRLRNNGLDARVVYK